MALRAVDHHDAALHGITENVDEPRIAGGRVAGTVGLEHEGVGAVHHRTRVDAVDKDGKVTVRYAGRLRHLGIGRAHRGRLILMLIHDRDVITSDRTTGEIIAYHHIDPAKNYQPKRDSL